MSKTLSKDGAGFILSSEAIFLEGYPDPATNGEPITIGAGHTAAAGGMRPRLGDIITLKQAMDLFRQDMKKYEVRVNGAIKVPIDQPTFDMFVSIDFNAGCIYSGSIDDKTNRGDLEAALATMLQYVNAGGKRMAGLERRRKAEVAVIRTKKYPGSKILVKDRRKAQGTYMSIDQLPWGDETPVPVTFTPKPTPPLPERKPERPNLFVSLIRATWKGLKWLDESLSSY